MSESFTVRIITPTITREHHNVATISHQKGPLGHIALKNPDNKIIAFYKDSAYSAWHVVQDRPTGNSTRNHYQYRATTDGTKPDFRELTKELEALARRRGWIKGSTAKDLPPRDHLGRFTKRK